jgi:nitrous oxidase accessory protein NosD
VTANRFERNYRGVCSRRVGSPATPSVADLRVRDNDFVNNSVAAELAGTGHLIGGNRFVDRGGLAVDGANVRVERNVIDLGSPLFRSRPGRGLVVSGENVTVVANRITVPFGPAAQATGDDQTWRDNRIRDSASGLLLPTARGFVLRDNRISNVSEDAFGVGLTGLGGPLGDALFDHDIDRSNTVDGRPIVYVNNDRSCIGPLPSRGPDCVQDVAFDGDDMAAFYCRYCENVTLRNLSPSGTLVGVHLQTSRAVRVESVDVDDNRYGIRIAGAVSRDNVVSDSRVRGNRLAGIVLKGVAVRTEVRRNVVSESRYGIVLIADRACPSDTVVASNVIERNEARGFVYACPSSSGRGNVVYDNRFNNSWPDGGGGRFHANALVAQHPTLGPLTWNASARVGTNIAGGPRIGGNYWGTPEGDGFSDLCSDADGDGFCDRPFEVSSRGASPNTDYLPLARWAR